MSWRKSRPATRARCTPTHSQRRSSSSSTRGSHRSTGSTSGGHSTTRRIETRRSRLSEGRTSPSRHARSFPPYFPGYQPYCPYTAGPTTQGTWRAPDLATARALVARSGTRGMKVTVWSWADLRGIGPYTVRLLRSLGYRASLRVPDGNSYFQVADDSRTKAQIGTGEWISDYPAASGFFGPVLTCDSFHSLEPVQHERRGVLQPRHRRTGGASSGRQQRTPTPPEGSGRASTGRRSTRHRGCRSSTRK